MRRDRGLSDCSCDSDDKRFFDSNDGSRTKTEKKKKNILHKLIDKIVGKNLEKSRRKLRIRYNFDLHKEQTSIQFDYIFLFLFIMAQVTRSDFTFTILDEIQTKYPELVDLVLGSESIDNNEKQYWFDIMPSMTDEQIDRLFNILMTERRQLEELNIKYQEEIKTLNEKHLIQWQGLQSQKAKEKVQEAEKNDQSKQDADDALGMLGAL